MRIRQIHLENFRSYEELTLDLDSGVTAFVGPNGAGKTNILEAIHVLARGDSPRAHDDTEMVRWGAGVARASANVEHAEDERRVEVVLFAPPAGERRRPRRWQVNGAGKRADDATGLVTVVAFFPEEVQLLGEAPAARRRYLDAMLAQVDRVHAADTRELARVIEQRNAALRTAMVDGAHASAVAVDERFLAELAFWDAELCRLAARVSLRRIALVRDILPAFERAMALFAGPARTTLVYAAQVEGTGEAERVDAYRRLVAEKRERELWRGTTLVGPHREDLAVVADGRGLATFASRGEQRSVVLSLKLAEASWLREQAGDPPLLLLDDVLSELDPERRDALVGALDPDAQVLLTASLPAGLPASLVARARVVPVPFAP